MPSGSATQHPSPRRSKKIMDKLFPRLISVLPHLDHSGSTGSYTKIPDFDLTPDDYLNFADESLGRENSKDKIDCVSHLKRAIECQLDTFIEILGLSKLLKKKGIRFDRKMGLLESFGLISPRSFSKLNMIRNKLEHEYSIPDIPEVELYYDLANSFLRSMEGYIHMFSNAFTTEWNIKSEPDSYGFISKYDPEGPSVLFRFSYEDQDQYFYDAKTNFEDFITATRIHFILMRSMMLNDPLSKLIEIENISSNKTAERNAE